MADVVNYFIIRSALSICNRWEAVAIEKRPQHLQSMGSGRNRLEHYALSRALRHRDQFRLGRFPHDPTAH
jgi:hypothetical protein